MLTPQYWILLASILVPMATLLALLKVVSWRRSRKNEREPVSEKLLRPAGESLRLKLEVLDDQVNETLVWTFVGPATFSAILLLQAATLKLPEKYATFGLAIVVCVVALALLCRRLLRLINLRRDYRLGFAGERAVAEELNHLMLDGCRVFHDVPMEPYGNIDHVVLAASGIYAVETKARRKREMPTGKHEYEVEFDGKQLNFPSYCDSQPIDQVKQQSDRLRNFLSKAVGESVKVNTILAIPGWYVTDRGKSEIKALNQKGIRSAVRHSVSPPLSQQLFDRIAHQLDQRCRDVEF